jgi:hypothetical protein
MKPRYFFWTLSLIAVLGLSSCAPAVTEVFVSPANETSTPVAETGLPEATIPGATVTQAAGVQPAATSRGPELEATDPTIVNLASGQLQLVEFFRFT